MQHRLMILGSMEEFVQLVRRSRRRGIYTIVCDGYRNGPPKREADRAFDIDVRQTEQIAALCCKEQVDGIITSFSDLLAECMVDIAYKAGLKCYCTPGKMRYLRNKVYMKEMFLQLEIPTPRSVELLKGFTSEQLAQVGMPCVIKPLNGYGSRGGFVAHNEKEIRQCFAETCSYSDCDSVLAEPYNSGYEFNMMSWILDGKAYVLSITDREKSIEVSGTVPHVSRIVYPSRWMDKVYKAAREMVEKIAEFTGIRTGPVAMQFFYSPESGVQVCEAAGRLFGYEHELLEYASGLCLEELLLDYAYNETAMYQRIKTHDPWLKGRSAGLYFHGYEGRVGNLDAAQRAGETLGENAQVVETNLYYKPGDVISHGVGAKPDVARYYIVGKDYAALDNLTAQLYAQIRVQDDQDKELLYNNQIPVYIQDATK